MSQGSSSFERALSLTAEAGGYSAQIPDTWSQGRATYGGLVGALLARALETAVPEDRQLRSALIDFVAPAAPGAAFLEVRVLRAGRTLTHAEARLFQSGEVAATMTGVYAVERSTSVPEACEAPPPAPTWSALPALPYVEGAMPRFRQHFEYRSLPGRELFSGAARAQIGGYVRHAQGGPVDAAGLLGLIDAWPPPFMPILTRPAVSSSVTWMVDFVANVAPRGHQSDAFFRYEAAPVATHSGHASCDARLWGESGQLIAASRQLVAEFS